MFHPHYAVPYPFHYELIYVAKREENTRIADLFVLYNLSAFHQYAKLVKQIFMALGPTSASSSLLRIRLFLLRIRSEKNMEFYIHHLNFLNFYVSNRICIRNRATFSTKALAELRKKALNKFILQKVNVMLVSRSTLEAFLHFIWPLILCAETTLMHKNVCQKGSLQHLKIQRQVIIAGHGNFTDRLA